MKSPLLALQGAVYQRLKAVLPCPVYDDVPDGAAFPYVVIGEVSAIDWSTKPLPGMDCTQTLHVWSAYRGFLEVKNLIDDIVRAIVNEPIELAGFYRTAASLDMIDTLVDPEGYRHGVVRFRFRILEVA